MGGVKQLPVKMEMLIFVKNAFFSLSEYVDGFLSIIVKVSRQNVIIFH